MPRVLVTGATGFLGERLVGAFARADWHVTAGVHRFDAPAGAVAVRLELDDPARLREAALGCRPDWIVHAAALSNADLCEEQPDLCRARNVRATAVLAETARACGARFALISTDLVFDGEEAPYAEDDPPCPANTYGLSKVEAEAATRALAGPDGLIVRSALLYGWRGQHGTSFLQTLVDRLQEARQVQVFTDQYRSAILVDNAAEVIAELVEAGVCGETLHLGGPEGLSRHEFALSACDVLGLRRDLIHPCLTTDVKLRAPRPRDVTLRVDRVAGLLRRSRLLPVAEGLLRLARLANISLPE